MSIACANKPEAFNNYYLFTQLLGTTQKLFLIIQCVCEGFSPDAMAGFFGEFPTAIGLIASKDKVVDTQKDALIALLNIINDQYVSIEMVDQYLEKIVSDWKKDYKNASSFYCTRPMRVTEEE